MRGEGFGPATSSPLSSGVWLEVLVSKHMATAAPGGVEKPLVLTVGHSTRTIDEFIELLTSHGVERVVDVRTIPRSRRHPHFEKNALSRSLKRAGIAYSHAAALGGLRRTRADSPNGGWRNTSFRGYADHMQSPEFEEALEEIAAQALHERLALMCAEAVPWRCHRSLIADALLVRGFEVEDLSSPTRRLPHRLTPFARVQGGRITYPPPAEAPLDQPRL